VTGVVCSLIPECCTLDL